MSYQRIYANQYNLINGEQVIISDHNELQHLAKVLRIQVGELLVISDQQGKDFLLEVQQVDKRAIHAKIIKNFPTNTESSIKIYLLQGLAKGEKMDWIIQKAVELGAAEIFPLQLERCIIKLDKNKEEAKQARWQKIAAEAAAQSQRSYIPKVLKPQLLEQALLAMPKVKWLVAYEEETNQDLASCLQELKSVKINELGIIIGPEGGLTLAEVKLVEAYGGKRISLGKRILRTETAAIAALSILQFALGDIGGE